MTLSYSGLKIVAFSNRVMHEIHKTTESNALWKPFIMHSLCIRHSTGYFRAFKDEDPVGLVLKGFKKITLTQMQSWWVCSKARNKLTAKAKKKKINKVKTQTHSTLNINEKKILKVITKMIRENWKSKRGSRDLGTKGKEAMKANPQKKTWG